jgi:hypothetical protein
VVTELPNGHLDELAGGGVDELVELLLPPVPGEHDPTPGVEAGRSGRRGRGCPWSRKAHSSEADVVGHIVGDEHTFDNQTHRPIIR